MTYEVIGASAKDPNFQNRCRGAAIAMAADILNAVQDSGAIQDSKGGDLTTLASKNLAKNFCKGAHLFTDQALASLSVCLPRPLTASRPGEISAPRTRRLRSRRTG